MTAKKVAVIILAAGKGTRLLPLTEDMPKCMVPIAGVPLLEHMLSSLEYVHKKHAFVITVFLVVGFRADKIAALLNTRTNSAVEVRTVPNPDFATTNNLYSLQLAMDAARNGGYDQILWANGDCIYDKAILESALVFKSNAILCDSLYSYNEESMKIATSDNQVLGIGKNFPPGPNNLVSIDCYVFRPEAWAKFDHFVAAYCTGERLKVWSEIALHDFMQQENAKGEKGCAIAPLDIKGLRWMEIDNATDMQMAEKLWSDADKSKA